MIELGIQERWPEIEPRIVKSPEDAARYAIGLKFRWREAEPIILNLRSQHLLLQYIKVCVKERWEEAETVLRSDYLVAYALTCVRGRVPAIEKKLLESNVSAGDLVRYSIKVMGSRWPEFESIVDKEVFVDHSEMLIEYAGHHLFRWDVLELMLAKYGHRESMLRYSQKVLKGQRSLAFEQYFEHNPEYSVAFKKYCDLVDWSRPDTGPINDFVAKRLKRWMKAGTI